jgi:hypothetical protein
MQSLKDPSVTCVSSSSLTLSNDLDYIASLQTQIPRDRITELDSGQLGLLQPVSVQQDFLLLRTKQDMFWHQLMLRDVYQKILFLEMLGGNAQSGKWLECSKRSSSDGSDGDENACCELVLI